MLLVYSSGSKLDLEAGIELGYLVSGEERFNSFDMGMDIGVRYDLTERINIGLRYNLGFPFQFKSGDLDFEANQASYQQSVLQFSIGYNLIQEIKADN